MPRPVRKLSYEERKQIISRLLKGDDIKNIIFHMNAVEKRFVDKQFGV